MRFILILLCLFVSTSSHAQLATYYNSAFNHSGDSLKFLLNQIIKNHIEFPYTSSSIDVWDILKKTDRDPNDSNNVILIYSGKSVNAAQEYNSGSGWSREHVWAKSRGDFGTIEGAGADVHHLRPCDVSINSTRNNRNFKDCNACIEVVDDGLRTGSFTDANLWTFEPRDEVKGDIARMIFYMAVRYEGEGLEHDLELTNTLLTNTDKSPLHAVKSTLLAWNRLDTVSEWERNRNEIIYTKYQKNRNPFIDHPELSEYLWGDRIGYVWKPIEVEKPSNIIDAFMESKISVYPNPTNGKFYVSGEYKTVSVFDNSGSEIELDEKLNLESYPSGLYIIHITDMENKKHIFEIVRQ